MKKIYFYLKNYSVDDGVENVGMRVQDYTKDHEPKTKDTLIHKDDIIRRNDRNQTYFD